MKNLKEAPMELAVIDKADQMAIMRAPEVVLLEARRAAQALTEVIKQKPRPVKFGGVQYLEFEDWQTVGRFYGVTVRVVSSNFVYIGTTEGFEARAEVIRQDGAVISSAESLCMRDEPNWRGKPIFQVKSMAQTRACAKALRNVLAWVVVLAGFSPTPSEEMLDYGNLETPRKPGPPPPPKKPATIGEMEKEMVRLLKSPLFTEAERRTLKEWFKSKPTYGQMKTQLEHCQARVTEQAVTDEVVGREPGEDVVITDDDLPHFPPPNKPWDGAGPGQKDD
jgi:hypothetical protein